MVESNNDGVDGQMEWFPVSAIRAKEGHNPRRFFAPGEQKELEDSVKVHGVIQPIVIRPVGSGKFEIIAGERRWRAAGTVGLTEIPALIRDVDDKAAREIALTENTKRSDLAPSEEAQYARDFLTLLDGDREDAARRLGWSRSKLDSRLALLHCSQVVLDALDKREISLAHGELLATLPEHNQNATLPAILAKKITVAQLKARIGQITRSLDTAIFNKAACKDCPHNSEVQRSLFAEVLEGGQCSNPGCFGEKTAAALTDHKAQLAERFPVVALDTESAEDSRCVVEKAGPAGVGITQLEQGCRACAKYGVVLFTQPGREGEQLHDVCFDLTCHAEKKKAYQLGLNTKPASGAPPKTVAASTVATVAATGSPTASAGQIPKAVTLLIDARVREAVAGIAADSERVMHAVSLHALWKDAGYPPLKTHGLKLQGGARAREQALPAFHALDAQVAKEVASVLVKQILIRPSSDQGTGIDDVTASAAALMLAEKMSLSDHFRVDADFLKAHRKSGIEALLRESGFADWYKTNAEKPFSDLAKGKIADIVQAATASAFDWSGFVPGAVQKRFAELLKRR